ncbi:MAG: cation:proton antiporter [Candidatus Sericytochromatia bacterium]
MEIPLLNDIAIIFALSMIVIYFFNLLKIPSIIGFLLTGIIAGPYALELIKNSHDVEVLAEIGIVFLLFSIGVEFSIDNLLKIRRTVFLGGTVQVTLSILFSVIISIFFKISIPKSIFIGYLISLSSTAIVIKLMQDKGDIDTPHGKNILGILIFQDIVAIPMMLTIPLIAGNADKSGEPIYYLIGKIIGILAIIFIASKYIIPKLLYQVVNTRINELFLITIGAICISTAILTSSLGLSLALGAFIAGLIISESEYSHQALSYIMPFKDIFTSFFFVSVGMLLNIEFVFNNIIPILGFTFLVIILKTFSAIPAALLSGYPLNTGILSAMALSQVGEFSFVLSKVGIENKLFDDYSYQLFLGVSVISMTLTPFIINLSPKVSEFIRKFTKIKVAEIFLESKNLKDHIVIIGYGLNGQNLSKVAAKSQIPYIILEANANTVKRYKSLGEPIYYGDATHEIILEHLNIREAKVVVIAISDPIATRKIVNLIRSLDSSLTIIVRTRYLKEISCLYDLGANEVIAEELESSIEIFSRVLTKYLVSRDEIESFINKIREEKYSMQRTLSKKSKTTTLKETISYIPDLEISTFKVSKNSVLKNKTIIELDFRKKYNVTILAIQRKEEVFSNPESNFELLEYDKVVLMGKIVDINNTETLFNNKK